MDRLQRAGVTSRETDVLRLVGERLSNAEIAERIFVSVRTVESHVSSLLTKLDATSRGELRCFATRLDSPAAPSSNLLSFPSTFVGRDGALVDLAGVLRDGRVVSVVGAPGVGKTRVAVEFAQRRLAEDAVPVWFVDLASLPSGAPSGAIDDALARAVGAIPQSGESPAEAVASMLAGTGGLVVLDNCEQVVGAVAVAVDGLLASAAEVHVLATSREPLGAAGEVVYALEPLPVPPPGHPPVAASLRGFPAVDLFVDRAASASTEFELTATNAAAVATLCQRLDGIPLAIELAASRVRTFPTNELVAHLDRRFELLGRGVRTAEHRYRTLREAIDWSYQTLDDEERELFDHLGVFPTSFDFDAATAVAPDRAVVLRVLPALVDKSLVAATGGEGTRRYRLLETLRAYAHDQLELRGTGPEARDRHRHWFLELAEQASAELIRGNRTEWYARLDREQEHLDAALAWSLGRDDGAAGLRIGAALWPYWDARGRYAEGRRWLERLLAAAPDAPPEVRADAWQAVGIMATGEGDYDSAGVAADRFFAISRELGDERRVAKALNDRATISWRRGDFADATAGWTEQVDSCRRRDDERGLTAGLNNLAVVVREQGRYADAVALLGECLARQDERGDRVGAAISLFNLGQVHALRGELDAAERSHAVALERWESVDHRHGIAKSTAAFGAVAALRGQYAVARELLTRSISTASEIGDRQRLAYAVCGLGDVAFLSGDSAATDHYEESLRVFRALDERLGVAIALAGLAAVAARNGDADAADGWAGEAHAMYLQMGHRHGIATTQHVRAAVATLQGDDGRAAELARQALVAFHQLGCPVAVASCLDTLAAQSHRRGGATESLILLGAADAVRDAVGAPRPPVDEPTVSTLVDDTRGELGDDKVTALLAEGRSLPLDEVVERVGDTAARGVELPVR